MYNKLPKALYKHNYSKFLPIDGFGNDGVIIFTTLKKARDYTYEGGQIDLDDDYRDTPYSTISYDELYSELVECQDELNGGGYPLVLLVNPKIIKGNIQYESIMNIKDFVAAQNVLYDSNTYRTLIKKASKIKHPHKQWDDVSYESFVSHELNDGKDLIRFIAFAYSWMPTMAKVKTSFPIDWNAHVLNIKRLGQIESPEQLKKSYSELQIILRELIPVVNNSIVGLSKVLHFSKPKTLPIIDSRVIRGWEILFGKDDLKTNFISDSRNNNDAELYLNYWYKIFVWHTNLKNDYPEVTIRELEINLYLIGESVRKIEIEEDLYSEVLQ